VPTVRRRISSIHGRKSQPSPCACLHQFVFPFECSLPTMPLGSRAEPDGQIAAALLGACLSTLMISRPSWLLDRAYAGARDQPARLDLHVLVLAARTPSALHRSSLEATDGLDPRPAFARLSTTMVWPHPRPPADSTKPAPPCGFVFSTR
jgi:hypothetical protein